MSNEEIFKKLTDLWNDKIEEDLFIKTTELPFYKPVHSTLFGDYVTVKAEIHFDELNAKIIIFYFSIFGLGKSFKIINPKLLEN